MRTSRAPLSFTRVVSGSTVLLRLLGQLPSSAQAWTWRFLVALGCHESQQPSPDRAPRGTLSGCDLCTHGAWTTNSSQGRSARQSEVLLALTRSVVPGRAERAFADARSPLTRTVLSITFSVSKNSCSTSGWSLSPFLKSSETVSSAVLHNQDF